MGFIRETFATVGQSVYNGAWAGVFSAVGSALLAGQRVKDITLVARGITIFEAGSIGGLAVGSSFAIYGMALLIFEKTPETVNTWYSLSLIPFFVVPYMWTVPLASGVTIVALGALGATVMGK